MSSGGQRRNPFTNVSRLSERVWRVVEDDRFGQFPFMYVVLGVDKCVLIDTGCGTGDYRAFVDGAINTKGLPYLIVNTHVHFDHVGANHQFQGSPGFLGSCLGGHTRAFTENYPLNSLVLAHHGAQLQPFSIDRWLNEGDLLPLDDANPTEELSLRVIFTPGHTPDSIALYLPAERRVFAGDIVYPWTVIHVDCLGSSPRDYLASTESLLGFISSLPPFSQPTQSVQVEESAQAEDDGPSSLIDPQPRVSAASSTPVLDPMQEMVISEFHATVGLVPYQARALFDVVALMEMSDWDLESAVMTYLSNSEAIGAICPPREQQGSSDAAPALEAVSYLSLPVPPQSDEVMISCGHVSENLSASALQEVYEALLQIKAGEMVPSNIDDQEGIVEYAVAEGQYVLCFPKDPVWE